MTRFRQCQYERPPMHRSLTALAIAAVIAAAFSTGVQAATYKISVTTGPGTLGLSLYTAPDGTDSNSLDLASNDPILDGFPRTQFLQAAQATSGTILLTEENSVFGPIYSDSGCTGVFLPYCAESSEYLRPPSSIAGGAFNLIADNTGSSFAVLSSTASRISFHQDDGFSWSNALGVHTVASGLSVRHDITHFEVSKVPVPASLPLLLGGAGLLAAFGRRRPRRDRASD